MRGTLILMVKVPRPGRVKTRLGREIGMIPAAHWYRRQSLDVIRRLTDPRWDLCLAVSPDHDGLTSRAWPPRPPRVPQGRGDLGRRMIRLLRAAPGPAVLIGSDIPGVQPRHIARAFKTLGRAEIALGPATDGGFWLIGRAACCRLAPTALDKVVWSTPTVLSDTRHALAGRRIGLVDTLADVDSVDDLIRLSRDARHSA